MSMSKNWGRPAHIFGHDAKVHPVTGRYIEQGSGALPEHVQVEQQLRAIEREEGKVVADEMRRKLNYSAEVITFGPRPAPGADGMRQAIES